MQELMSLTCFSSTSFDTPCRRPSPPCRCKCNFLAADVPICEEYWVNQLSPGCLAFEFWHHPNQDLKLLSRGQYWSGVAAAAAYQ